MTTKKELKQHIAELRELIRVRDKKISELKTQNANLISGKPPKHVGCRCGYTPKFEQVCKDAAEIVRLGDLTVNSGDSGVTQLRGLEELLEDFEE